MPADAESLESRTSIVPTSPDQRLKIYAYIGFLFLVIPFISIWGTSAKYFLKDTLHLKPEATAGFLFYVHFPAYLGFLFGFVRDRWSPFRLRDQGMLLLFSGISTFFLFATSLVSASFISLAILYIISAIVAQFLGAATQSLTSVIGQEHRMTGRLSAVWQAAAGVPVLFVSLIAGDLAEQMRFQNVLMLAGAISLGVFLFCLWRPREVYDAAEDAAVMKRNLLADVSILAKTKALYPVVALLFLWNFTPGVGTPIQYYLSDTLHGGPKDFGKFNAIFSGCFIPTYLLYGYLCTKFRLPPLLWVCTVIAVPQILPLLLVKDANTAMIAAVPMGLMGGLATAGYFDLLIKACPPGLQGTVMMLGASAWVLSGQLGDVAGARLFGYFHSFAPCAWATALVYAFMIPIFALVPKQLTLQGDGELPGAAA